MCFTFLAGKQLQVFDVGAKKRVSSRTLEPADIEESTTADQDHLVHFWTFTSNDTIALVTASAVFTWHFTQNGTAGDGPGLLKKQFPRHPTLVGPNLQIIGLKEHGGGEWSLLSGIEAGPEGRILGHLQLWNSTKQASQAIEGHVGAFGSVKDRRLFACAHFGRIRVVDIEKAPSSINDDADPSENFPPTSPTAAGSGNTKKTIEVELRELGDFFLGMHFVQEPEERCGLLWAVSKYGRCLLIDALSGILLADISLSADANEGVFASVLASGHDLLLVNRRGQVPSKFLTDAGSESCNIRESADGEFEGFGGGSGFIRRICRRGGNAARLARV